MREHELFPKENALKHFNQLHAYQHYKANFSQQAFEQIVDLYKPDTEKNWDEFFEKHKYSSDSLIAMVHHPEVPDYIIDKIIEQKNKVVNLAIITNKEKDYKESQLITAYDNISPKNKDKIFKNSPKVSPVPETINTLIATRTLRKLEHGVLDIKDYEIENLKFIKLNTLAIGFLNLKIQNEKIHTALCNNQYISNELRNRAFNEQVVLEDIHFATPEMSAEIYMNIIDNVMSDCFTQKRESPSIDLLVKLIENKQLSVAQERDLVNRCMAMDIEISKNECFKALTFSTIHEETMKDILDLCKKTNRSDEQQIRDFLELNESTNTSLREQLFNDTLDYTLNKKLTSIITTSTILNVCKESPEYQKEFLEKFRHIFDKVKGKSLENYIFVVTDTLSHWPNEVIKSMLNDEKTPEEVKIACELKLETDKYNFTPDEYEMFYYMEKNLLFSTFDTPEKVFSFYNKLEKFVNNTKNPSETLKMAMDSANLLLEDKERYYEEFYHDSVTACYHLMPSTIKYQYEYYLKVNEIQNAIDNCRTLFQAEIESEIESETVQEKDHISNDNFCL
jgi:hypothetical protein